MIQAPFHLQPYNPDVLMCIANLSSDEVFTPPELVNQMLDTLAESWSAANNDANIWADKDVTFLDPSTKSGVFLREITKRLIVGLEKEIPDLTERVNHILTKQIFGIAITELTALLARRSVYCSKYANGIHSVARRFNSEEGNIWFERTEHEWVRDACRLCGAAKSEYARSSALETHAYRFIHSADVKNSIKEVFGGKMHFDVVIGNPPYQLGDSGFGTSAIPIYQHFVNQGIALDPRFLVMVIPARWFAGGKGLDEFREKMLSDERIREIHDFPDSSDVFPGTQIKGGVCFFLWNRDHPGNVRVTTYDAGQVLSTSTRPLKEPGSDVFIRYNEGVGILKKVNAVENSESSNTRSPVPGFASLVSSRKPFGLPTTFKGRSTQNPGDLCVYQNGGIGYVGTAEIATVSELVPVWKVFIPPLGSGSDSFPHPILGKPFVGEPGAVCTETYLAIGPLKSRKEAENVCSYISTKLFRFLVLLHKPTQHATRQVYSFVPMQDFKKAWTDDELYKKYKLNQQEIDFIESMIRPMGNDDE